MNVDSENKVAEKLRLFREVTHLENVDTARRFLELCEWNVDDAVMSFYQTPDLFEQPPSVLPPVSLPVDDIPEIPSDALASSPLPNLLIKENFCKTPPPAEPKPEAMEMSDDILALDEEIDASCVDFKLTSGVKTITLPREATKLVGLMKETLQGDSTALEIRTKCIPWALDVIEQYVTYHLTHEAEACRRPVGTSNLVHVLPDKFDVELLENLSFPQFADLVLSADYLGVEGLLDCLHALAVIRCFGCTANEICTMMIDGVWPIHKSQNPEDTQWYDSEEQKLQRKLLSDGRMEIQQDTNEKEMEEEEIMGLDEEDEKEIMGLDVDDEADDHENQCIYLSPGKADNVTLPKMGAFAEAVMLTKEKTKAVITFEEMEFVHNSQEDWGVSVDFSKPKRTVSRVDEGKQFHRNGVQEGWRIVSVNDIELTPETKDTFDSLLKQGEACRIKFRVRAPPTTTLQPAAATIPACFFTTTCHYAVVDKDLLVTRKQLSICQFAQNALTPRQLSLNIKQVDGVTLRKVCEYLRHHNGVTPAQIAKPIRSVHMEKICEDPWDAEYINSFSRTRLFQIILAANYMDIQTLLHLGCAKVATMIKGKSPEEITQILSQPNEQEEEGEN